MRIATFNANNLFSRWSFSAELPRTVDVDDLASVAGDAGADGVATPDDPTARPEVVSLTLADGTALTGVLRKYQGQIVRGKDPRDRRWIARRIAALDADVLCLQEVEDQSTLDAFCAEEKLDYPFRIVVEGNDPRMIDVALCSRLPVRRVSSWRFWPGTGDRVFGRDLLQVEIIAADGAPVHVFVNHLKSNFIPDEFRLSPAQVAAARAAIAARRTAQSAAIAAILRRQRLRTRLVVVGDLNDDPASATLAALGRAGLTERIGAGGTVGGPDRHGTHVPDRFADLSPTMWTHRHRAHGVTSFGLYDQVWTSADLPPADARVMRRTQLTGDGSDHDPAYVDLAV